MIKLKTENGYLSGDGSGELGTYGVLTAKSNASISVRREDTTLTTCAFRAAVDMSLFRLGEKVKMHCHLEAGKWIFSSLSGESASIDEHGAIELYVYGALQARSGAEVVVRKADGTMFGCNAPAELNLSYFRANEQVKLRCRLDGGARTLLSVNGERYSVGADGSAELYVYGSLTGNSGLGPDRDGRGLDHAHLRLSGWARSRELPARHAREDALPPRRRCVPARVHEVRHGRGRGQELDHDRSPKREAGRFSRAGFVVSAGVRMCA